MHPILLEIGPIKIFTYGLLVATGFFTAIILASKQGEKEKISHVNVKGSQTLGLAKKVDNIFYVLTYT